LDSLDYPRNLYDIYVIADNCTDSTALVARHNGAHVLERHDPTKKSKGYGLEWAFNQLWNMEARGTTYDAVLVLDADNLVTPNTLKVLNQRIVSGAEVLQLYLDSKNPKDSWISKSYAYAYWATNRIYQLAREKLGLSAQLGGTGMCFKTSVLKNIGWGTESLTEDLEYVARYALATGKTVRWVHTAKTFDEKPLKMKASFIQRCRWARGHIDCSFKYGWSLLKMVFSRKGFIAFDIFLYLFNPSRIILTSITMFAFLMAWLFDFGLIRHSWVWFTALIIYYIIPFIGLIMEKKSKAILWTPQVYLFSISWVPIWFIGLLQRKKKTWNKTVHTRSLNDSELQHLVGERETA
ncbi:glycosyltransferase family 2 protein, partial [Paenibacillus larvae]|uniref:glycosyltransferase family 2 protein n=2 Tax=Paenibacillus larvae TaxID=1464 RepID=UPI0018D0DC46